jgi:hypothetical protein
MRAASNHQAQRLSAGYYRQVWQSLLSVLRNTRLSGGTEVVLVPARVRIGGRAPRISSGLARMRD